MATYTLKYTGEAIDSALDAANAALPATQLDSAINTALENAKASGEFDGADGAPGATGATGDSAYDIAVENGFEGSETEWLESLKGASGQNGSDGVGITNIEKTSTVGLVDTQTITLSNGSTYTFTVTNGASGGGGGEGGSGVVYMRVSDGYIQYSNDGITYINIIAISELKGADGSPGEAGAPGANGVSCTHSWDGTVLTITSASGTSSADLQGPKGDKGDPGESAAGVDYSTSEVALGINWIDGKPIYRRVVSFLACQANDAATTSEAISDFDTIISFNGALHRTSDGEIFPLNYYKNTAAWIFTQVDANGCLETTGKVSLAGTVIAWIDYTKTTD